MDWDGVGFMKMSSSDVDFHKGEESAEKRTEKLGHYVARIDIHNFLSPSDQEMLFERLVDFLSERVSFKFDMITRKSYYLTVLDNIEENSCAYDIRKLQTEVDNQFHSCIKMKLVDEWDHISIDRWRGDELDSYQELTL